jgi:hypothetical protein
MVSLSNHERSSFDRLRTSGVSDRQTHGTSRVSTLWIEAACVLGIVLVAALWSSHVQQVRVERYWDADEYYMLAEQMAAGGAITVSAPYAYRVLTPWLVARVWPTQIVHGFLIVNIVAGALSALLLAVWLRRFVDDWRIRVLVTAAYVWEWHGPIRMVYYYPVYVDPLFIALAILGLILVEQLVDDRRWTTALALSAVTALGVLAREMMLLVPLCALAHRGLVGRHAKPPTIAAVLVSLAAGCAALLIARLGGVPRGSYSFAGAAMFHLVDKPVFTVALAWYLTFGAVITIVLYDWRNAWRFLCTHRHLGVYLVAFALLAYVGGHDTERYLFWASPVVYALVGIAIERHRQALSGGWLVAVLVAAQAISERVFWPIPSPSSAVAAFSDLPTLPAKLYSILDRLFVIDDFHWNLWSNFGSRPFHLLLLAVYAAFSLLTIRWIRTRASRLRSVDV